MNECGFLSREGTVEVIVSPREREQKVLAMAGLFSGNFAY